VACSTALRCAIGIGRLGALRLPLTVGLLADRGWWLWTLYVGCAVPLLLAAMG